MNMHALVTGGAGFIGSHLCEVFSKCGFTVTIFDNFSSGSIQNISKLLRRKPKEVSLWKGDCTNLESVKKSLRNVDVLFHFAANPEVRLELCDSVTCFQQNVYATHVLLEATKNSQVQTIVFASTSTVYGEAKVMPTPEDYSPLEPISIYGASKLASEALITAYAHSFDKNAVILRLANIVGPRCQHGVIHDFVSKIKKNPTELEILGDGTQTKSYLYIDDCIEAILVAFENRNKRVEIFNIGSEDQVNVKTIASIVAEEMGCKEIKFKFTGGVQGGRGWIGDVKTMLLDVSKLKQLGWKPKLNSAEAVRKTTKDLLKQKQEP
jgi:UDP-glucose 4-epimerase